MIFIVEIVGSFTPLVFETNGGMGADCTCNCFLKRPTEKLSEKNEEFITLLLLGLEHCFPLRF